jgi:hypothetical protein
MLLVFSAFAQASGINILFFYAKSNIWKIVRRQAENKNNHFILQLISKTRTKFINILLWDKVLPFTASTLRIF